MSKMQQITILLVGMSTAATGQPAVIFQDLDALDAQIAASLGAPAGSPGGAAYPLDRRLRLAACNEAIRVAAPSQGATAVSCGPNGWRIRVAVLPSATPPSRGAGDGGSAGRPASAAAAAEMVARGEQVRASIVGTGFSVSTMATAEESGAQGQRIRIRIEGRARPVYATVTGPREVEL